MATFDLTDDSVGNPKLPPDDPEARWAEDAAGNSKQEID